MKKVLSVVLAALLMLSMTSVAFAADEQPVAGVKLIKGTQFAVTEGFKDFPFEDKDLDYLVGAIFTVDKDGGKSFEDYLVDFKLTVGAEVDAEFYGKYSAGEFSQWLQPGQYLGMEDGFINVAQGEHHLFEEYGAKSLLNVATVVDIGTFYCALYVDPDTAAEPVDVSLSLDMYEKPAAGAEPDYQPVEVTEDSDESVVVAAQKAPSAIIKMVEGRDFATTEGFENFASECGIENIDMNYVVGAYIDVNDMGIGYDDYYVDFVLDLAESVDAAFFGKYDGPFGPFGWTPAYTGFETIPAGQTNILSALNYEGSMMTVAEASEYVEAFYCAFYVDPNTTKAPVSVSLLPAVYEAGKPGELEIAKEAAGSVDKAEVALVTPVADITMIEGKDFYKNVNFADFAAAYGEELDMNNVVGAVLSVNNGGLGFEDYLVDFKLNLSETANVKFFGKYDFPGANGWVGTENFIEVKAEDYYLIKEIGSQFVGESLNLTVDEVVKDVETFYCVLVVEPGTDTDVITAKLNIVMYEEGKDVAAAAVPVAISTGSDNTAEVCKVNPTAKIKMIPGSKFATTPGFESFAADCGLTAEDMNYVVGAHIDIDSMGKGFENDFVDFVLNLDAPVEAKFFGKYNAVFTGGALETGWVSAGDFKNIGAGKTNILSYLGVENSKFTLAEVNEYVDGGFYCAFYVNPDTTEAPVNVSLVPALYKEDAGERVEAEPTEDSVVTAKVALVKPVAGITMIPGRDFSKNVQFKDFAKKSGIANLNMDCVVGAEITLISTGEGFENALVDFKLGVSEAVDAMLYGKYYYGDVLLDWTAYSEAPVKIGEDGLYVLGSANNDDFEMKLSEVDEMVGTFYCVLVVDPDTAEDIVNVTLDTVVYDKPEAEAAPAYTKVDTTVGSVDSADVCRIRPVVEIEMIDGADFGSNDVFKDFIFDGVAPDCVVGAKMTITDMGKFFDDSLVDFRLNLSDDVNAKVYGSYVFNEGEVNEQAFSWTSLTGDEYVKFNAGDNYILDIPAELAIDGLTLAQVNENVGTFYCIFEIENSSADYEAINTTLDLVVYDEPADGAEVEYIAADCDNNNKSIVLGGWDVVVDGEVDVIDYQAVVNIALGNNTTYTEKEISSADIDSDGSVDVLDAVLVERVYKRN